MDGKGTKKKPRAERRANRKARKLQNQKKGTPSPLKVTKFNKQTYDTRVAKLTRTELDPSTQQPAITIEVPLQPETLFGVCVSYVSKALSRGYLSRAETPDYPYFAAVYMVNLLIAYAQGITPKATSLPYWLQCFGQALAPKTVPCQQGYAFYRFVIASPTPYIPPSSFPIGSPVYGYEYLLYKIGAGDVDGFPIAAPSAAYSDDAGASAWSSLAQFMQNADNNKSSEVIPLTTTTWAKNVSAYAMPTVSEGLGWNVSGGEVFQAGLEVPVHTPVLAVFANTLATGAINPARYQVFSNASSGDALFASACFQGLCPPKNLGTKRYTKFHPLDFLEFQDVVASWAAQLVSTAFKDSAFAPTVSGTPLDAQCPITLQEMGLLLRNEMMAVMNASQCATQSIYPRDVSGVSDNEFVPFVCSSTTVSLGTQGMKLPLLLAENIKSLVARWVQPAKGKDPMFFCPILGKYNSDDLVSTDYQATTTGDTPTTIDVFTAVPPVFHRRRLSVKAKTNTTASTDGEVWEQDMVEAPINFCDGGSGSNYLFINEPKRLQQLVALWNEWVERYATYSMALTTATRDQGVNICSSVGVTRHWVPPAAGSKIRSENMRDMRLVSRRYLGATLYADREAVAISSYDRMLGPVYDQISSLWILPINKAVAGLTEAAQSSFQREQIIRGETASVSSSAQDSGTTLSTLHGRYAQAMVKGPNAPASDIETFFVEQTKNGKAGILSGLVAGFIGKAFGPTAGSIAGTVSELLPI